MVGPVQGGSPPPQVSGVGSTGSGVNTSSTDEQIFEDTLATLSAGNKSIVILSTGNPQLPRPSLFSYMQTVSLASVLSKQNAYLNSSTVSDVSAKFYRNMIFNALDLLNLLKDSSLVQSQTDQVVQDIDGQIHHENNEIDDYNSNVTNDNTQSTQINQAANTFNAAYSLFQTQTDLYNQGLISPEEYAEDQAVFNQAQDDYNDAVVQYNNYANPRNDHIDHFNGTIDPYNEQVALHNEEINIINIERAELGLDPLPFQETFDIFPAPTLTIAQSSPPAPVPVPPIITPSAIPLISDYPTPTPENVVLEVYLPAAEQVLLLTTQTKKGLRLIKSLRTFVDFYLHTKTTVFALPPAFASKMATGNTSTSGVAIDAGLAAIASSLDPVIFQRVLNKGAQNASYDTYSAVLKPGTIDATLVATANALAGASMINAQELLQSFQDSIKIGDSEEEIRKALTLQLSFNILDLVHSGGVSQALRQGDGTSDNASGASTNAISSTLHLSLLGVSTNLISTLLGLPGLGGQLLGLAGISSADVFNLTNRGIGFNSLSSNPFTRDLFAKQLSSQIVQSLNLQNVSGEDLAQLQNNINNSLLQAANQTSSLGSSDQFFNNFSQNLANNGISAPVAAGVLAVAQNAFFQPAFNSSFDFRNNLQQSLVNQGFTSGDAQQISSSIAGVSPQATGTEVFNADNINRNLLTSNLAYLLQSGGITTPSEIAARVASNLLANTQEIAEATFRDDLVHQLEVEGLTREYARRVAAGTVIPLTTQNNPLLSSTTTNFLSQGALHEQLVASIKGIYSPILREEKAEAHARNLADLLVGPANANAKDIHDESNPLSLVSTLHQQLNEIKNLKDQTVFDKAVDNFKRTLEPSTDLLTLSERITDPGLRAIYANNIMTAQPATTGPVKMGGTNPPLEIAI